VIPHIASQRAKERTDLEQAFFGGDPPQPIFTTSSHIECNTCKKKKVKTSISQSCTSLEKLTLHLIEPPKSSKLSAREASFARAIPNKIGKASLRTVSLHHISCQNLVIAPSPTSNIERPKKFSQPLLMFFHNPTPKAPAGSKEH